MAAVPHLLDGNAFPRLAKRGNPEHVLIKTAIFLFAFSLQVFHVFLVAQSQPATEQQVWLGLANHSVVLRNFYTDSLLQFDKDGKLVSSGSVGFGPIEGQIYLREVQVTPGKVSIVGDRPVTMYDETKGDFVVTSIGQRSQLEILLQDAQPDPDESKALMKRIFLTTSELDSMSCSPQEAADFRASVTARLKNGQTSKNNAPQAQSLDELHKACFPGGERAYFPERGLASPKPLKTPNPQYSEAQRKSRQPDKVELLVIVDTTGKPTSAVVTRRSQQGIESAALAAARNWRFEPATFHGTTVPVVMQLEFVLRFRDH